MTDEKGSVEEQPDMNDEGDFSDFLSSDDPVEALEAEDPDVDEVDGEPEEPEAEEEPEEEVEEAAPLPIMDRSWQFAMPDGSVKTAGELIDSGMATADYTRKTQAAAEMRRRYEEALVEVAIQPNEEPDWSHLARTLQPQQYMLAQAEWQTQQRRRENARAQWQEIQAEKQAEEEKQRVADAQAAVQTLMKEIPELNNPKQRPKIEAGMLKAAQFLGYEKDELTAITDARLYRGLHLVAQALDIQESQPAVAKKLSATSKTLAPSARTGKADTKAEAKKARAKLRQTGGSDEAFADFLFTGG